MPAAATIDHHTLARLADAHAVRGTHVVAKPGGWGVIVKYGATESALAATRSKETRVFKRLETLVGYLKGIGISRFDVDAADFDAAAVKTCNRPDTSATLERAHAALAHDRWFRDQVGLTIDWLPEANQNSIDQLDHIAAERPLAAADQDDEMERQVNMLHEHLKLGRPGRVKGTRAPTGALAAVTRRYSPPARHCSR